MIIGSNLTIEKIPDFIHVNLKIRYFNMEFQVFLHAIDMIEDIIDDSRDNTLLVGITNDSLHCVCLTCIHRICIISLRMFYSSCFRTDQDSLPDDV